MSVEWEKDDKTSALMGFVGGRKWYHVGKSSRSFWRVWVWDEHRDRYDRLREIFHNSGEAQEYCDQLAEDRRTA